MPPPTGQHDSNHRRVGRWNRPYGNLKAWFNIAAGIDVGVPSAIALGNEMLLRREQRQILSRGYRTLDRLHLGEQMGAMAESPIPGGRSFSATVPGGNLANFDDRWKWITSEMLPNWLGMSPQQRADAVKQPLGNASPNWKKLFEPSKPTNFDSCVPCME